MKKRQDPLADNPLTPGSIKGPQSSERPQKPMSKREREIKKVMERYGVSREIAEKLVDEARRPS